MQRKRQSRYCQTQAGLAATITIDIYQFLAISSAQLTLAGSRLRFIGVHDKVVRAPVRNLRHERVLQTRRKARTTAAAQTARLDLINQPVASLPHTKAAHRRHPKSRQQTHHTQPKQSTHCRSQSSPRIVEAKAVHALLQPKHAPSARGLLSCTSRRASSRPRGESPHPHTSS
jgi:hypothetical protein